MRRPFHPIIHLAICTILLATMTGPVAVAQGETPFGLCHTDEATGDVVYLEVPESEIRAHMSHGDATAPNGPDDCATPQEPVAPDEEVSPVEPSVGDEVLPTEAMPDVREEPVPVAQDDEYTVEPGEPLVVPAPGVLANDPGFTTATLVREPSWGTLDFGRDGSFTYTADREHPGSDAFAYQGGDEYGNIDIGEVYIYIPNVPPVAADDTLVLNGAGPLVFDSQDLLANDYDANGDPLSMEMGSAGGYVPIWDPWAGGWVFIPLSLVEGEYELQILVTDGTYTVPSTLTIEVNLSANAPIAQEDSYKAPLSGTFTVSAANGLLANDSSPAGSKLTSSFWKTIPSNLPGKVKVNPDGSFTLTSTTSQWPGSQFVFYYRVTDSQGRAVLAWCTITFG